MAAGLLIFFDYHYQWFKPLRAQALEIFHPLYEVAGAPVHVWQWFAEHLQSRRELQEENASLRTENLVLHGKLQKLSALTIENIRLRELLNSTETREENTLIAEIIAVSPEPYRHFVVLNKGSANGAYVGQAVVDARGLFGQIETVSEHSSTVVLISDARHSVPVQVDRNGIRLIANGTGDYTRLQIPFVTETTDLVAGDILSTSGLGGVFPGNYPVARVVLVEKDLGQAFMHVLAEPFAELSRTRYVLLLFKKHSHEK